MNIEKTSFIRWIWIVLLGLTTFTIISVLSHSEKITSLYNDWSTFILSLNEFLQIGITIFGFILIYVLLKKTKSFNLAHLNNIKEQFKFPPIYFSVAITILCFFISGDLTLPVDPSTKYSLLALTYITVCLLLNSHEQGPNTKNSIYKTEDLEKKIEAHPFPAWLDISNDFYNGNFEQLSKHQTLYTWAFSEKPITHKNYDMFGRSAYVERISNALLNENTIHHIALVGPKGSGKSSICNMIERQLQSQNNTNSKNLCFIYIDGWGRSEKAWSAQILDEIIEKLSEFIDCAAIRSLPQEYLNTLSGADFIGSKSLASLLSFHSYSNPEKLLKKIDNILLTINKKIIVVLEDFDRNTEYKKTINDLAALLDRLRDLRQINFILCIGSEIGSDALSRISTYREDISNINSKMVLEEIENLMLANSAHKKIELIDIKYQNSSPLDLTDYTNKIITTPRELKFIIRRCLVIWENLQGEINIFDLIAINILRYTSPNALDYITNHINYFRDGLNFYQEPTKILIRDEFSSTLASNNKRYLDLLVSAIFPNWNSDGVTSNSNTTKLQRAHYRGNTNYFKRVFDEGLIDKNESDQEAFKKFKILRNENPLSIHAHSEIINQFCSSSFYLEKIMQFGDLQSDSEPVIKHANLYRILYKLLINTESNKSYTFEVESIHTLYRYLEKNKESYFFSQLIEYLIIHRINDALFVYDSFNEIKDKYNIFSKSIFDIYSNPSNLIKAIKDNQVISLGAVYQRIRESNKGADKEKITIIILDAFEEYPEILAPYVSELLKIEDINYDRSNKPEPILTPVLYDFWSSNRNRLYRIYKTIDPKKIPSEHQELVEQWKNKIGAYVDDLQN